YTSKPLPCINTQQLAAKISSKDQHALVVHKQHGRMPPLILSLYKIVEPFHRYLAKSYRETYAIFQAWIKLTYC
ncbi:hypothetical protein AB6D21_23285, partial [Vibrio splendidus]